MDIPEYDVVVVGGGPAGMMAAGTAAHTLHGKGRVILIEKNPSLGVKLLITGGGRCNVTNAEEDVRVFLKKYKESDKYLFSAFSQFNVKDTLTFFNSRGMPTKVEAEKRVFPVSNSSQSVWDVLVSYMKEGGVEILTDSPVLRIEHTEKEIQGIVLKNKKVIRGKKYIIATGGTSRPETGSTGEGFNWFKDMGHTVIPTNDALVPLATRDGWVKNLKGLTLTDIKLTTYQNNQKQESHKGKILFTHFGVSGPTVLNMSKDIGELLKYGEVEMRIDLLPHLDHGMLNGALQALFKKDDKKKIKNSLDALIPHRLVEISLGYAQIDGEKNNNSVTREERMRLIDSLKGIPIHISGLLGSDKAVVSSGGIDLNEIDFKNMQSKKIHNLYVSGDVLNIDRPSGGYSLQLCWTTGYIAGKSAAE